MINKANSSMQLTRAADYAVRVMIHLAGLSARQRVSLSELAEATATPVSFLSKVLQALSRGRLISSRRGQGGGFVLSVRGRESTMLDVIEAIDGPITLNVCLNPERACGRKEWCPAHPVWVEAQKAMVKVLQAARIADLAEHAEVPQIVPAEALVCEQAVGSA